MGCSNQARVTMIWKTLSLAAVVALSVSVQAQQPPGGGQQTPAAAQQPPAQSPQQPTFRLAIDLVRTDVIVRDNRGQFVADLKPERVRDLRGRRQAGHRRR